MEARYNQFTYFELSPDEQKYSLTFSDYNLAFIQNERSRIAQELLEVVPDPEQPLKHIYREIELKSQVSILGWLIDAINSFRKEALKAAQDTTQENPTSPNSTGV